MAASYTFIVTGTNRGIGLAYTTELLKRGHAVIATARKPDSNELRDLQEQYGDKLELVSLNVAEKRSVDDAATAVAKLPIAKDGADYLINNAGVFHGPLLNGILGAEDPISDLRKQMDVNVYGTLQVTLAFLPLLRKKANGKKTIVNVTSGAGSFDSGFSNMPISSTYSISKTAVNMLSVKLHGELAAAGFTVVPMHPGLVQTDMSAPAAKEFGNNPLFASIEALTPADAAKHAVNLFLKLTPEHSARFFDYKGDEQPW
ncbi:hypothetical protein ACM66B_002746 [Microbotryomycetes sp. NB124-2]